MCCALNFPSLLWLLSHIRLTHRNEPGFATHCNLEGYNRTFACFPKFRNHIYSFHGGTADIQGDLVEHQNFENSFILNDQDDLEPEDTATSSPMEILAQVTKESL